MIVRFPFDPIERAGEVERLVMDKDRRKYYRFRGSRYYGGIATADTVGCCFLCAYCWNYKKNLNPDSCEGEFLSPEEVAGKILKICRKKSFNKVRITGAEPVLGERSFQHLLRIIEIVSVENPMVDSILETNGLLLGFMPDFSARLSQFKRLFVRVSIKGWDEASFERITGAKGEFFFYTILAIKNLLDSGVYAWPAFMMEIFGSDGAEKLGKRLKSAGIRPEEMEIEYLEPYPFVLENMRKRSVFIKGGLL